MRSFLLISLALLFVSCAQQKQTTATYQSPHRYKTVYEGNKIIKYEKVERHSVGYPEKKIEYDKGSALVLSGSRQEIDPLPRNEEQSKFDSQSNTILQDLIRTELFYSTERNEHEIKSSNGVTKDSEDSMGTFGFVLSILAAAFILTMAISGVSIGLQLAIGMFSLWLAGLIASVVGLAVRSSKTDVALAIIGLIISVGIVIALLVIM